MNFQLFKVGKIWHVRYSVDRKRVQQSTGETDRQRAEQLAERRFRHARLWARDSKEMPTLSELTSQWLVVHVSSSSRAHVKVVETFGRLHLHGLGDVLIDELTTDDVELARVRYLETHAPVSANQWLKVLRLLCNWAVRRGLIPAVPFRVRALKVQKRPRATLPVSLVLQWLAAIDARERDRDGVRTAVRLMLGLGLRESETITARWEWLDIDRRIYVPGRTKGREADPLPVPDWLFDYLMERRQPAGLMLTKSGGKPYAAGFTRAAMLDANRAVGAPHVTPHRLRGSFATLLSREGVPVQDIQRALRHKNLMTTASYLEVDLQTVALGQRTLAEKIGFGLHVEPVGAPVASTTAQTQQ
ncbi:tyrosine-type recombinase/integrase [Paraburkholderia bannensis]|uniref:tyrosine-type recombinase/integrase n=1 Tax=Paraburkholderia bannensis TaxID=765414 RepID=UPI002AC33BDD|nr:site-specific integrase [Paraburkholderia bannensis]